MNNQPTHTTHSLTPLLFTDEHFSQRVYSAVADVQKWLTEHEIKGTVEVFGSSAAGFADVGSDVDICIGSYSFSTPPTSGPQEAPKPDNNPNTPSKSSTPVTIFQDPEAVVSVGRSQATSVLIGSSLSHRSPGVSSTTDLSYRHRQSPHSPGTDAYRCALTESSWCSSQHQIPRWVQLANPVMGGLHCVSLRPHHLSASRAVNTHSGHTHAHSHGHTHSKGEAYRTNQPAVSKKNSPPLLPATLLSHIYKKMYEAEQATNTPGDNSNKSEGPQPKGGDAPKKAAVFRCVKDITTAIVPIIKLVHIPTKLQLDVSADTAHACATSQLLRIYADFDMRLVEIVILTKAWAHHRGISRTMDGFPGTYAFSLAAVNYFQSLDLLPILSRDHVARIVSRDPHRQGMRVERGGERGEGGEASRDEIGNGFMVRSKIIKQELNHCETLEKYIEDLTGIDMPTGCRCAPRSRCTPITRLLQQLLAQQKEQSDLTQSANSSSTSTHKKYSGKKTEWASATTKHAARLQTSAQQMRLFMVYLKDHLYRILDITQTECPKSEECFDVRNPLTGTRASKHLDLKRQRQPHSPHSTKLSHSPHPQHLQYSLVSLTSLTSFASRPSLTPGSTLTHLTPPLLT
eukprot:GHVN01095364.1.p1 GENE.GHVN01095364.1~~GHVN01095364.1.p1  ORF type:complete len:628 (+),score=120.54 GHVN01095364.1:143-2026(+)